MLAEVLTEDASARTGLVKFAKVIEVIWACLLLAHGLWLTTQGPDTGMFIGGTFDGWVKIIGVAACLLIIWKRWHSTRFNTCELMLVTFASQLTREGFAYASTDPSRHGGWPGATIGVTVVALVGVVLNAMPRIEKKGGPSSC
ncbi:MAG: hypothetical protein JWO89_3463 [Verrucomicrobiaceae bacterium]|nr:hypothetical protein [Verrucomicrobiaceae bacterium]MDB6119421.1 hypothetical protein [Verrucomicrobiaceae bacterium]